MPRRTPLAWLLAGSLALPHLWQPVSLAHAQDAAARDSLILARLYPAPDSLLWHENGSLSAAARSAIGILGAAAAHGLDPVRYDAALLDSLARRAAAPPEDRAGLDRLLTQVMARYLDDLRGGRAVRPEVAAAELRAALEADTVAALARAVTPPLVQYRALQRTLVEYRALAGDSSLRVVAERRLVRPGERFAGAARLARLLAALGDLPAGDSAPAAYAGALVEGIRTFQWRHGLEPDGVIGPATFAELAVPLEVRVRQLELALERVRRLPPFEGPRLLVVNVPAFEILGYDSAGVVGTPAFSSRAVVGRALDTRTPMIFGRLRQVEFWPYWNVPRSILVNEILPLLGRHPGYLRDNRMEVVDGNGRVLGNAVSAQVLDGLRSGTLRVRQRPGAGNALGPVKLVFPNPSDIYIHGTPNPELFIRARRDLSHGCIRVEDVTGLTAWALRDQRGWTRDSTSAVLRGGRNRRLVVDRPIAIAVVYLTAAVDGDGRVHFREDLYGLDPVLDREMRAPLRPRTAGT